jgi:cytoskeletal protein RodZ
MADVGTRLREAREGGGIPLRQIADRTKISVAALEALERGDMGRLPGGIFGRSFVRSYAAEVGLDPDAMVREFLDQFSQDPRFAAISIEAEPAARPGSPAARTVLKLVAVALVAVGIILYLTLIKHASDPSRDPRPDSARRTARGLARVGVPQSP